MQANGDAPFLIDLKPKHAFSTFFIINTISFYVVNYLALLGMVYMVWQIRHTDDDTFLRQECVCLVLSWVFFSIIQYAVNVYNFIIQCENNNNELSDKSLIDFYETTFKIIYWVIILRDLVCLCIMVLFQYRAATSQLYFSRLLDSDGKDSAKLALQDFEMLLVSVVPHKAFQRFLSQEHPEMIPYLQMIHLCKLFQDDQEELEDLKEYQ